MSWKLIVVAFALTLAGAELGNKTAPHKSGEITLEAVTKVGDITLKPGVYRVEYEPQGTVDLMSFSPVSNPREEWMVLVNVERGVSRPPWKRTEATISTKGKTARIEKIVVKGEKVAYRFD